MRRFLFRSVGFLCGVALLFTAFLCGSSAFISKGNYFSVPSEVTMLFAGHSHSACAYEDSIIKGSYNISQNTEGYPYTYFKLKKILEHNDHIQFVFIEFTNNQITPFARNRVSGSYLDVNMPRNFPVMDASFVPEQFLQNKNPKRVMSAILKGSKSNFDFLTQPETNYINSVWRDHKTPDREYEPVGEVLVDIMDNKKEGVVDDDELPSTNLHYLQQIVKLCEREDVRLFFVRSPMPMGVILQNETEFQDVLMSKEFESVVFLDFKDYRLPNKMFADKQHLNSKGQENFSNFVNLWITSGALELERPEDDLKFEMGRRQ